MVFVGYGAVHSPAMVVLGHSDLRASCRSAACNARVSPRSIGSIHPSVCLQVGACQRERVERIAQQMLRRLCVSCSVLTRAASSVTDPARRGWVCLRGRCWKRTHTILLGRRDSRKLGSLLLVDCRRGRDDDDSQFIYNFAERRIMREYFFQS